MIRNLFYLMLSAIVLGACGKHGSDDPVEPDKEVLTLDKHRFEVPADGGTFSVKVTGNVEYTVTVAETCRTWLQESSAQAVDQTHIFKVAKHEVPKGREGYVVFDGGTVKDTVYVFQVAGVGADFTETVAGASFEMVYVKAGTFTMGDDADLFAKPAREVTLTKDYYIGKYEVTQGVWKAVMGNNPSCFDYDDDYPLESVSWNDFQEFIVRLNRLTGRTYALPTEAQWEYAARGGEKSKGYKYSGSDTADEVGWFEEEYETGSTHPVGQKKPNELGIYDMSGNVKEWCQDWYGKYDSEERVDPVGPESGSYKVNRGENYLLRSAIYGRIVDRSQNDPTYKSMGHGFRLVLLP